MSIEPFVQRIIDEHADLDERLEKLHVFIEESPNFMFLPKISQRLLVDQRHAMTVYRDILRKRIAHLNPPEIATS